MTENPWKTISQKHIYENPWIKVIENQVINPSGGDGIYGVVHFKHVAVGIIPLDENYNTWIVGQYRYTLNQYSWEIPEGGGKLDVAPLESAKRELLEETGIRAEKWTKLLETHTSNSVTDELGVTFIAQNLSFGEAMPDDTEDLQVKKMPFSELFEMVMRGEITDGFAMSSILKAKILIDRGEI